MPLGSFLKILLSGMFTLAVLFVIAVEFSIVQTTDNIGNYESYEYPAKEHFESFQTFVVGVIEWFGHLNAEELIALFTGILAVSTIGLWVATQSIFRHGRRTTERQLRAYIAVEPRGVLKVAKPANRAIASIGIRNAGHLPAIKVGWKIDVKFSTEVKLNDFLPVTVIDERENVVSPNVFVERGSDMFEADQLRNKRDFYLYVWGAVFYEDGFGEERFTNFCHRYNCVNFKNRRISAQFGRYHRHGNQAD